MTIDRTNGAGGPFPADDDTAEVLRRFDLPAYIAQAYPACKMSGSGYTLRCVATWRGGEGDNVAIYREGGKWKWTDHAGGEGGDALDFLQNVEGLTKQAAWDKARAIAHVERVVPQARPRKQGPARQVTGEWFYTDEAGATVFKVQRVEPGRNGKRKDYSQSRPDGKGGWITGLGDVRRDLVYRIPEVQAADLVYVVEGEKCADRLRAGGLVATCNAGGAEKWTAKHARHLAGKHVVVLADNDKAGRKHVEQVKATLRGVAASIKAPVLEGLPEKGDVFDWLEAGRTIDDLRALVDATPEAGAELDDAEAGAATEGDLDDDQGDSREAHRRGTGGSVRANLDTVTAILQAMRHELGTIYHETFSDRLRLEPGPLLGGNDRDFTDRDALIVTRYLQREHHMGRASDDLVYKAARLVGFENARNALSDWLDGLAWDGEGRLGGWLVPTYGVDDNEYTRCVGWNWLISMVARAYEPGEKVDHMPVLEGAQGIHKSDSLQVLINAYKAPKGSLRDRRFATTNFDPSNKDFLLTMRGRWLVEIAELHGLQKSDREAIKAYLTRQKDSFRAPYARQDEEWQRTCVFVGTTNETEYLSDPTGARRFWPLACRHVDLAWLEANRDQLWAEAVAKYKAGETWWEMPDEVQAEQEARTMSDTWEGPILNYLNGRPLTPKFEAHAILHEALGVAVERQNGAPYRRLKDILTRHGWTSKREGRENGRAQYWHRPQA